MRLIDADKFLGFLIFSKHIDNLKCKEVKEAVEMCKVDVLEQIRDEIESQRKEVSKKYSEDEGLLNYYFGLNDGLKDARDILDKYKAESEDTDV